MEGEGWVRERQGAGGETISCTLPTMEEATRTSRCSRFRIAYALVSRATGGVVECKIRGGMPQCSPVTGKSTAEHASEKASVVSGARLPWSAATRLFDVVIGGW